MIEWLQQWRRGRTASSAGPAIPIETAGQRAAVAAIGELIARRTGVILLEAGAGMGKTAVLLRFQESCDGRHLFSLMFGRRDLTSTDLHRAIGERLFGPFGPVPDLPQIAQRLVERRRDGQFMVLLIDRAERLSASAWAALSALAELGPRGDPALTIVLSGRPPLAARLARPKAAALQARGIAQVRLPPLSPAEAVSFIGQWLEWNGDEPSQALRTPTTLGAIADAAEGVPGRLIGLAARVRRGPRSPQALVRAGWRPAVLAVGLGLLIGFLWSGWPGDEPSDPLDGMPGETVVAATLPAIPTAAGDPLAPTASFAPVRSIDAATPTLDRADVFFLPARRGDTLEALYHRAYPDPTRRPPYERFVAANPDVARKGRLPPGQLVAFPGPIGLD
jgi:type II secretory pathway predicted ATPase ExeA